MMMCVIAFT